MVGVASPDAIAVRAYEIFQERGREPGRDVDDWLRAEQELQGAQPVTAIRGARTERGRSVRPLLGSAHAKECS